MEPINQSNSGSNSPSDEKLSALVVDDTSTLRTLHKFQLSKLGFSTMAVENGKEAIDLYSAGSYFDIIIMDMEMPVMNGIEATKKLRAMGVKSLIIGATASTSDIDIENFKNAGLDKCYAKPLSGVIFHEMLEYLKKKLIMAEDK